ncbi:ceramide kinase [Primulina huaijiensis]|uniref:ceramide kinase n=1 Tax=Primulina huaijiensis TaxID=1492673 RepID=UPI003CC76D4D
MERNENVSLDENPHPNALFNDAGKDSILSTKLFLDYVGEVVLTLNSDGLSWKLTEPVHNEEDKFSCLRLKLVPKTEAEFKFSDVYAANFIDWGLVHASVLSSAKGFSSGHSFKMYRFMVHVVQKSNNHSSLWTPSRYSFGHENLEVCEVWVNQINCYLHMERSRPKSLLVFVHPKSGKGNGCRIWEAVVPLFSQAKVKTKVIVTERAGHARDLLTSISDVELRLYDGVIAVGGDGFFNEILNGLLLPRHKAPYPPAPGDFMPAISSESNLSIHRERTNIEPSDDKEDQFPLLTGLEHKGPLSSQCGPDPEFYFPSEEFRFGIIPAGSTDAIVICTTGARDPVTSALHIILGKRVHIDIAQVVRWKMTNASNDEPCVRYAASFAGYGFYGDVITESEKYRWMGPKRYDYAGTKVFLQHRSYEAEVNYVEVESEKSGSSVETNAQGSRTLWQFRRKPERMSCRANCTVCNETTNESMIGHSSLAANLEGLRWSKSKGHFLSVGAAVISCRNEKAPDGLVADAHLSDGFLHLILIKDCPHPSYLWHLIQLTRKGGKPLDFNFVEHHKTPAFTFTSFGKEGVWNVDGELFHAHKLSAQVFRGLVSLFGTGPDA